MPGVAAVVDGQDARARTSPGSTRAPARSAGCSTRTAVTKGEEVAAVAAETPYQAWDAVRAITVEYEVLPFVADYEDALKPNAPAVHDGGQPVRRADAVLARRRGGGLCRGRRRASRRPTRTACEIHTPIEVHGRVAKWDGPRLVVWESTQGVYPIQAGLVAGARSCRSSSVRVIGHYMGGGFGTKLSLSKYTVIAALLAKAAARPVKLHLTREESFLAVGNRPPDKMTHQGRREEGRHAHRAAR